MFFFIILFSLISKYWHQAGVLKIYLWRFLCVILVYAEQQSSRAAEQQSSRGKNYLPTIFLLLLTIIISPQITMGQTYYYSNNYLENGSFEIQYYNSGTEQEPFFTPLETFLFPNNFNQVSYSIGDLKYNGSNVIGADGWFSPNNWDFLTNKFSPSISGYGGGTSDYYHEYGTGIGKWGPDNTFAGFRKPAHGKGYVGFLLMENHPESDYDIWKEYVQTKVPNLLTPGDYDVSFRVSKARPTIENGFTVHSIGNIGAYFSRERLVQDYLYNNYPTGPKGFFNSATHPNSTNPIVLKNERITTIPDVNGEGEWDIVEGSIHIPVQTGGYSYYLTIGHFDLNDPVYLWNKVDNDAVSSTFIKMYYFIDSVIVRRKSLCEYNVQITQDKCHYDEGHNKVGTEYTVTITKQGECINYDNFDQIRISVKGGIGNNNTSWAITDLVNINNNPNVTVTQNGGIMTYVYKKVVIYDDEDIDKLVGLKAEVITNYDGGIKPIDFNFTNELYEPCCDCYTIDLTDVNTEDWIEFEPFEQGSGFVDAGCPLDILLNIPSPYDACFTHFKLNIETQYGGVILNSAIHEISDFQSTTVQTVLRMGETADITITLYKGEGDEQPCIISKNYKCPCKCSDEGMMPGLITFNADGQGECDEDNCSIQVGFNTSPTFIQDCFTHVRYSSNIDGFGAVTENIVPLSSFDPSVMNLCLELGDTYHVKIELMKGLDDEEPCLFQNSYYCKYKYEDFLCAYPCENEWEKYNEVVKICDNCELHVTFYARKCGNFQDIQVVDIQTVIGNTSLPSCCNGVPSDSIFHWALRGIIAINPMKFDPFPVKPNEYQPEFCHYQYRVAKPSCWATLVRYKCLGVQPIPPSIDGLSNTEHQLTTTENPYDPGYEMGCPCPQGCKKTVIHKACQSDCCRIWLEVCRYHMDPYEITRITQIAVLEGGSECIGQSFNFIVKDDLGQPITINKPCVFNCNILFSFGDPYVEESLQSPGEVLNYESANTEFITKDDIELKYSINTSNNGFSLSINETNARKITLTIHNLYGTTMYTHDLQKNQQFTISNYPSGVYFYSISADGIMFESDKFFIIK